MRTSPTLLSLPALALALVLTGCGGDDDSSTSADPTSTSSSAEESSPSDEATDADEGTDDAEDPAADAPEGTVQTDLVSFDAPEGWQVITPEDAQAMTSGEAIEDNGGDFLEQAGLSADQLVQMIGQADAVVLSGEGRVGGFIDNINVITQPGEPASEDLVEQQLGQIGATVEDVSPATAAGQDVSVVSYLLPVGEVDVQGRGVQVAVGDETVTVTVSAREAATADAALDTVLASLTTLG